VALLMNGLLWRQCRRPKVASGGPTVKCRLDCLTKSFLRFKQAEKVWTESLFSALTRFGIRIGSDREPEVRQLLGAYAREFLDKPFSEWPDSLSAVQAGAELLTDDLVLEVIAHVDDPIEKRVSPSLRSVFARRLTDLPTETESFAMGRLGSDHGNCSNAG